MEKVKIDDVDRFMSRATVMRPVSRALGTTDFVLNYYEVEPGDAFSTGYHTHMDQEEVFYVLDGTATFDTEDGEVTVGAGEAVRFAPGEYQHGHNDSDGRVVALAMGAPPESEEVYVECPECGAREEPIMKMTDDRDAITVECPECGAEITRMT